jgi:hypothetical protein
MQSPLPKARSPASTFDTLGFFARIIEEYLQLVAGVFDLTDDEVPKDIALTDASVALIKTPMWSEARPGTVAAVEKAVAILQENGVTVEEVPLPVELADVQSLKRIQKVVVSGEAQAAFADKLVAGYSVIIMPSVIEEAPLGFEDMGSPAFNTLWTVSLVLCCLCDLCLSYELSHQRDFTCPSSTYLRLSDPTGCLSVPPSLQADIAISIC